MVKRDCIYHRYESEENYTLDMCSKHPEKLYGVTASDCDVCETYTVECSSTSNDSHTRRRKMELPDYIGIKRKQFSHYQFEIFEDGLRISTSRIYDEEKILDAAETAILNGYTFEVFEVNRVVIEYEDEGGTVREYMK